MNTLREVCPRALADANKRNGSNHGLSCNAETTCVTYMVYRLYIFNVYITCGINVLTYRFILNQKNLHILLV